MNTLDWTPVFSTAFDLQSTCGEILDNLPKPLWLSLVPYNDGELGGYRLVLENRERLEVYARFFLTDDWIEHNGNIRSIYNSIYEVLCKRFPNTDIRSSTWY